MHGFINKNNNLKNICVVVFERLCVVLMYGHWLTISTAIKHGQELLAPVYG